MITFFIVINVFHREPYAGTSLEKQLEQKGPIASRGSVHCTRILRQPIAICDCPGVGGVVSELPNQINASSAQKRGWVYF